MTKKVFIILSVIFISASSSFSQTLDTPKLDSFLNTLSDNNKAMGSVAISKNGKIIYARSMGYSFIDGDKKIKATNNTLYHIGSITKMYTATMIYQLIDEGKLSLETTLDTYYPQIPNAKKISVQTLLNHRSGLYDFVNDVDDPTWLTRPLGMNAFLDKIVKGEPNSLPNEKTVYSNTGYLLLTKIIEKITGASYNQNLQKRICSKIGLAHTYSPITNTLGANEATSYSFINSTWAKVPDFYFPNVAGVGDILATTSDLILFDEALINGKLISDKSLTAMKTFIDDQMGAGIMKIPFEKRFSYGHGGDTRGTHSIVGYFPDDSISIAMCINGEAFPHNAITIGLLSIIFNEAYDIPTFKTFEVSSEALKGYVGIYASKEIPIKIAITQDGKVLSAQGTGQPAFQLDAIEKDEFSFPAAKAEFKFNTQKKEMVMKQRGKSFLFTKEE